VLKLLTAAVIPKVTIKGKSPGGKISYRGKTWNNTTDAEAKCIGQLMIKMLKVAKIERPIDGFVLDFNFDQDKSGEGYSLGKKGTVWGIGLKWSHFESALSVAVHEIGHLTQVNKPGGMGGQDYAKRRVAHEKQAWVRGLALLRKVGFDTSKEFMAVYKATMSYALGAYDNYFSEKGLR
jgi:hypothetical protein